jgi:hypothetical protein
MGPREPISIDASLHIPLQQTTATADFSVIDPYRMMRTDGSAEKSTRPIVHAWCVRVNINATRCSGSLLSMVEGRALMGAEVLRYD